MSTEFKSQTSIEGHSIAHIVCLLAKPLSQQNSDLCYDPSYAPSLVAMLMTMLMTMLMAILRAIADRSPLEHRLVPKPTLFRVSLCSPESYR